MNGKLIIFAAFLVIGVVVVTSPAYAASSTFIVKAQKYISKQCSVKNVPNETSVLCYLFEKSSEQDKIIADLEKRVEALESKPLPTVAPTITETPTPTPTPTIFPSPTP